MRRSINFGSIFRRKDDQQPADSSEQAARGLLAQRLAERKVTLKESDLKPLTAGTPPLDWANVNGQLTLRAGSIDGLLQGRARIRAGHLKTLTPSPIGPEVPDVTEYAVALAAVIPQIDDLLQSSGAETSPEPEFDTPFTALAEEDRARFENANNKNSEPNSHSQTASAGERASSTDVESPQAIRTEKGTVRSRHKISNPSQRFEPIPGRRSVSPNRGRKLRMSRIRQPNTSSHNLSRRTRAARTPIVHAVNPTKIRPGGELSNSRKSLWWTNL